MYWPSLQQHIYCRTATGTETKLDNVSWKDIFANRVFLRLDIYLFFAFAVSNRETVYSSQEEPAVSYWDTSPEDFNFLKKSHILEKGLSNLCFRQGWVVSALLCYSTFIPEQYCRNKYVSVQGSQSSRSRKPGESRPSWSCWQLGLETVWAVYYSCLKIPRLMTSLGAGMPNM